MDFVHECCFLFYDSPSAIRAWLLKRKSGIFPCAHNQLFFIYGLYRVCVRSVRVITIILFVRGNKQVHDMSLISNNAISIQEKWEWFERGLDFKEKLLNITGIRNLINLMLQEGYDFRYCRLSWNTFVYF